MAKLKDMHTYTGDPWHDADPDAEPNDNPDPAIMRAQYALLTEAIDALPAGSLSGGMPVVDDMDVSTWRYSSDPAQRAHFKELYGEPLYDREGLTPGEKQRLYNEGHAKISQTTQSAIDAETDAQQRWKQAEDKLWRQFRIDHPEEAGDWQGISEAAQRLVRSSGMSREDLIALANERPQKLSKLVVDEMYADPGTYDRRYDGGSTGMIGGGSGYRQRPNPQDQPPRADDFGPLGAWQRKHGFRP